MASTIPNVAVLGTGVLGFQTAFQTALHEFGVTAFDIDDQAIQAVAEVVDIK